MAKNKKQAAKATEVQVFENEQFGKVRGILRGSEAWFVGKDVASALGYTDTFGALKKHVDDDDKQNCQNDSFESPRGLTLINESGVYSLIFTSKLPAAKVFKHWVTHDVLPAIRKTGGYIMGEEALTKSEFIERANKVFEAKLKEYEKQEEIIADLKKQLNDTRDHVIFALAVASSEDDIYVGEYAKLLCKEGAWWCSERKLFKWFVDNGWLMRRKGKSSKYIPVQHALDGGYMRIKERASMDGGKTRTYKTVLITGKGQVYFAKKILDPTPSNKPQKQLHIFEPLAYLTR